MVESSRPVKGASRFLLLAPILYVVVASRFSAGLANQPQLVLAWTPESFERSLQRAEGPGSVHLGIWLDMVFVCSFALIALVLMRQLARGWLLPSLAAVFDTTENVLLYLMANQDVSEAATRTLAVVAVLKFIAYGFTLAAVLRPVRRPA